MPRLPRHLRLAALLACCLALPVGAADRYQELYDAHDFFALNKALAADQGPQPEQTQFYAAATLTAFNRTVEANRVIDALLKDNVDTDLTPKLLELRLQNDMELSDYPAALDTARTLVDIYERRDDAKDLQDAQNTAKLVGAVSDVPPQEVLRHGASRISLQQDGKGGWCVPVEIGRQKPCYILDSGANYSVLIRSEAQRLGLEIHKAGVDVGSSTDLKVKADMAVAPVLKVGNLEYHNVVFLVMPDSAFTFKDFQIRGILGYQVFAGMGAVTTLHNHVLQIPAEVPAERVDNIAMDGRVILVQVNAGGHDLLCRLDTGADRTEFYEPYYRLARTELQKHGKPHELRSGGAGGVRSFQGYRLRDMILKVAGRTLTVHNVDVHTTPLDPHGDHLMCNLGLDALEQFRSYTINVKAMSLTLH